MPSAVQGPSTDSFSSVSRSMTRPLMRTWTIHQPPSQVTSISKPDIGASLDEAVGVFTHEHEIGQAPAQRPSGHAIVAAAVDASPWLESRAAEQRLLAAVRWSIREQGWRAVEPAGRCSARRARCFYPRRMPIIGDLVRNTRGQWITQPPSRCPTGTPSAPAKCSSATKPVSGTAAAIRLGRAALRSDSVRAAAQQTLHVHFKGLRQGSASVRISNK